MILWCGSYLPLEEIIVHMDREKGLTISQNSNDRGIKS